MIWLILLIGLIIRLISLDQSLWLDEAINVLAAKHYSFLGMITEYARGDFHPPGYFIILWAWAKVFGYSEMVVRFPSVIFGSLTVWLVFLIGQRLHSKSLGLIAAAFLAINPLHIYYSQEARMYSLAALAVSLNMWFFINLIKGDKDNRDSWIKFTLSSLLVLASDYVAYLIFLAQLVFLLISRRIQYLRKWSITLLISLAIFSIWLPIFFNQLQVGLIASVSVPAWKEIVGSFGLKPLILTYVKFIIGRIDHPNNLVYGSLFLIPGLLFLFLLWRGIKFTTHLNRILLLNWVITPVILGLLISAVVPIYSYFRLLFVLPAFVLLVAIGILSFQSQLRNALIILVVLLEIVSTFLYLLNPIFQREDWKGLVNYLKAKSGSKILLESSGELAPFEYYANDEFKAVAALKKFPARNFSDVSDLQLLLENNMDVYLINYLVEISDPQRLVRKRLLELGYQELDIKNFHGVGFVYHFIKNE